MVGVETGAKALEAAQQHVEETLEEAVAVVQVVRLRAVLLEPPVRVEHHSTSVCLLGLGKEQMDKLVRQALRVVVALVVRAERTLSVDRLALVVQVVTSVNRAQRAALAVALVVLQVLLSTTLKYPELRAPHHSLLAASQVLT